MKTSERKLLKGYYWNHDAIRKDMDKLRTVIGKVNSYSPAGFGKVHNWFKYHEQCILAHHHGEDAFFFPKMREKQPDFVVQLNAMEHEHVELDNGLARLNNFFAQLSAGNTNVIDAFVPAAQNYIDLVIGHLDKEEIIVENVIKQIPEEEVLKTELEYRQQVPRSEMSLLMPWMVDAMDDKDKKYFFDLTPFFVKWIYNFSAKPKFQRITAAI